VRLCASHEDGEGGYAYLAQRRGTDAGALRPRGGDLHEPFLQFGQPGCPVGLGELRVDVETLLGSARPSRIGEVSSASHCSIWARRFSSAARLRARTFGALSAVR
jgi:hypothetical protein